MAASRFVEVSNKEISEIKMNLYQKNTKKTCQGIFTLTSSRQIFPDNHLAFGE